MKAGAVKRALGKVARALPHARGFEPLDFGLVRGDDGQLHAGGVALGALADRHGTPLYVVDEARLEDNARRFLATPPGAHRACEVYASYKTNPVPRFLQALHALGVGAEVASPYELWLALELGVAPKHVIFNGTAKSAEALALAIDRGVGLINLNGREDVALVAAVAHARRRRVRVGVRVVVPGEQGGQFGERLDTGAALETFKDARRRPELDVVALHSHVNGELATQAELDAHVRPLLAFVDTLRDELGLELQVLDVGGNLASRTSARFSQRDRQLAVTLGREPTPRRAEDVLSIDAYVARVVELVEQHFANGPAPAPRVFVEPGRALMSDTMLALLRVQSVRGVDDAGLTWAVLDGGINVVEPVPNEFHQLFPVRARHGPEVLYRFTGPSCTLGDLLYPAWRLPEVSTGDVLAVMDAGAYFVPLATNFSFVRPAVVAVKDGRETLWRRAETYEDLVARDVLPRAPRPVPTGVRTAV